MVRLLCQVLGYVRGAFTTDLGCVTWAGGACEHLHGHKVPSSSSSVYQDKAHLEAFANIILACTWLFQDLGHLGFKSDFYSMEAACPPLPTTVITGLLPCSTYLCMP